MHRSWRAPWRALVPVAALGALLTGCTGPENAPKEYGTALRTNFLQGCIQDYQGTPGTIATGRSCECMYTVFEQNVPASEDDRLKRADTFKGYSGKTFDQIDHEVKADPAKINDASVVGQAVLDKLKACIARPEATSGSTLLVGPAAPAATSPPATGTPATGTPAAGAPGTSQV